MNQDSVLFVSAAAVLVLSVGFGLLFAALRRSKRPIKVASAPSHIRLRPMARLLNEDDFRFLAAQPGYHPEIGRKLRLRRISRHWQRIKLSKMPDKGLRLRARGFPCQTCRLRH